MEAQNVLQGGERDLILLGTERKALCRKHFPKQNLSAAPVCQVAQHGF